MIILFGSYARGDWVEDIYTEGHITYEYISDFDILVLTRLKKTANNFSKQNSVDDLILNRKAVKTPVSVIYHSVAQVNYRLKEGRYFFSDIKKRRNRPLRLRQIETWKNQQAKPSQKKTNRPRRFQNVVHQRKRFLYLLWI